jgi:hypothetical protein
MKKVLWSVLLCGLAAMPAIAQGGTGGGGHKWLRRLIRLRRL